jgi:hypothetical protein
MRTLGISLAVLGVTALVRPRCGRSAGVDAAQAGDNLPGKFARAFAITWHRRRK